jgi:hypothetical protein
MLTNSKSMKRTGTDAPASARQPSAPNQGAAGGRVQCPSSLPFNYLDGGLVRQRRTDRPEGLRLSVRRHIQE